MISPGEASATAAAAFSCKALWSAENNQTAVQVAAEGFGKGGVQFFARSLDSDFSENKAVHMFRICVCGRVKSSV